MGGPMSDFEIIIIVTILVAILALALFAGAVFGIQLGTLVG